MGKTSVPKFRFNLPDFGDVESPFGELVNRLERMMAPYSKLASAIQDYFEPFKPSEKVGELGWLPHYTTPFAYLEEDGFQPSDIEKYYRDQWDGVRAQFTQRVRLCNLDKEANEVLEEMLFCHEKGAYRAVVRLAFPEIERLTRRYLAPAKYSGLSRVRELEERAGDIDAKTLYNRPFLYVAYRKMRKIVYANADTFDAVKELSNSPIPNRHAAMHGLIDYNTAQTSLNSIILSNFAQEIIGNPELALSELLVGRDSV